MNRTNHAVNIKKHLSESNIFERLIAAIFLATKVQF